ncbi:MAG: nuclear transport factor 2 family protein [Acidimicrobiales bacterium]
MSDVAGSDDHRAVVAANEAFYGAFEAGDMDAMRSVWTHTDRAVCTHPGSPMLRGWTAVERSWQLLLGAPLRPTFILTDVEVDVVGDAAFVTLVENMVVPNGSGVGTAINWFVRDDDRWLMVGHVGAPITREVIG